MCAKLFQCAVEQACNMSKTKIKSKFEVKYSLHLYEQCCKGDDVGKLQLHSFI